MKTITRNQVIAHVSTLGLDLCNYANSTLCGSRKIALSGDLCFSNNDVQSFVYERSRGALTRDAINHPFHTQSYFIRTSQSGRVKTIVPSRSLGVLDCGKMRFVGTQLIRSSGFECVYNNRYTIGKFSPEVMCLSQNVKYSIHFMSATATRWILHCVGDLDVEIR